MNIILESLDHPVVVWCERTGYPSWNQPKHYICEKCGDELEFDECYADEDYNCLCEFCLLKLHRKW